VVRELPIRATSSMSGSSSTPRWRICRGLPRRLQYVVLIHSQVRRQENVAEIMAISRQRVAQPRPVSLVA
jgi:hypothetical protein